MAMLTAARERAFIDLFKDKLATLHINPSIVDAYTDVAVFEADKKTLIPTGEPTEHWCWLLYSGMARGYVSASGKEVTCELLNAGKFILPTVSLNDDQSLSSHITQYETISRCILLRLPMALVQALPFQALLLDILNQYLTDKLAREHILMVASAQERIERLRAAMPCLYEQVSQKYLASFIAISSEAYSRNK